MAFIIPQRFEKPEHHYDAEGDVLYISFGPPVPAVSLPIEDWFVLRLQSDPPQICGITIIGFKRLFSKVRPELLHGIPERLQRLEKARFSAQYIDSQDTLTIRFEDEQPSYYERMDDHIYLERATPGDDIIGFRITGYTEHGVASMGRVLDAMCNALFSPPENENESIDALTRAFVSRLDLARFLVIAA